MPHVHEMSRPAPPQRPGNMVEPLLSEPSPVPRARATPDVDELNESRCCVNADATLLRHAAKFVSNRVMHLSLTVCSVVLACALFLDVDETQGTRESSRLTLVTLSNVMLGVGSNVQMVIAWLAPTIMQKDGTGGVLVDLGIDSVQLTRSDHSWLNSCATLLCAPALVFIVYGINMLRVAVLLVSISDRVYYVSAGLYTMVGGPSVCMFLLYMFYGATLATRLVLNLTDRVSTVPPSDSGWATIQDEAVVLATEVMPRLSAGFGPPMVAFATAYGIFGIAEFVYWLSDPTLRSATVAMFFFGFSLAIVWPLAAISNRCDGLMVALNATRMKYINVPATEAHIVSIENALRRLNLEQGLGFTIFGSLVDKRLLVKLAVALVSIAPTIFGTLGAMRPGTSEDQAPDKCVLNAEQSLALQNIVATFGSDCVYNVTIGPNGVIPWKS